MTGRDCIWACASNKLQVRRTNTSRPPATGRHTHGWLTGLLCNNSQSSTQSQNIQLSSELYNGAVSRWVHTRL
jgi:hypothetical protein